MFLHGMEFPSTPSKHPRLENYDPDCGFKDRSEFDGGEEVGLSLGLGLGQKSNGSKSGGLTFMQMQELQHQSLIYKYIDAGLPVPLHLLVPIWKSVSGSFSRHFPAIIGGNPWMPMEYGRSLDPEPGRCRRTDGKKWRCGKEAVSNHKYCERHMHRGRQQRSRKLVEASGSAPPVVVPHLRLQPQARSIEPSTDHVHTDMGLNSNTNLWISLSNSNTMKMNSDVSVSPSSFAFSAKKAESSLCF